MRDNHFYQRLNQIRNKYGYNIQNQPSKNIALNQYQPHNTAQTYRDVIPQNNLSPQRISYQNIVNSNNFKGDVQKPHNLGISPNRNLERQKSQQNTTFRQERTPLTKYRQLKTNLNQTQYLDTKPAFKNLGNENISPSPIKKLRIQGSYQSSPTKFDKIIEKNPNYSPLKPYNRTHQMQTINTHRRQNKSNWPQTPGSNRNANTTFRSQTPFDFKPPNSARNGPDFEHSKSVQKVVGQELIGKESVFMQKFDYNVQNIQKIQDKINSILNRQK